MWGRMGSDSSCSPSMAGSMSKLSTATLAGSSCPTSDATVANRSVVLVSWPDTCPAGMCPGQRAMKGTRCPPSQPSRFIPRSPPAASCPWSSRIQRVCTVSGPLSELNITRVRSSISSSSSASSSWPVRSSSSRTKSPRGPAPDDPAYSGEGRTGAWEIWVERTRKKGSSGRSSRWERMKARAFSRKS